MIKPPKLLKFGGFFDFVSLLQVYLVTEMQLPIIYIMSTKIELIK